MKPLATSDSKPTIFGMSVMMFLQFFIWGAWYASVGNFMKQNGMADYIGWAYTVGPIAAIVSPFFLGFVADRYFATERVLCAMHLLGGIAMMFAPTAAEYGPNCFIGVLLVHMLCYMPTLGLTNTLAFHNLTDSEKQFPVIRVFGTIGWIAANLTTSLVFKADASNVQFYITGVACFSLSLFSPTLPHTPPPAAGTKVSVRQVLGLDALALLKQPSFVVFIVGSFLICIPLAAYYAFAQVFVGNVGFAREAATLSVGQMSEIVFMLLMPLFFVRLGVKWMLAVGMAAWVGRYALFSVAATNNAELGTFFGLTLTGGMSLTLLGIILHGICYDFFFVTGFIYTDKKCSPQIRGQAQGFLVLVTQGLGLGLGAQIMQRVVDHYTEPTSKIVDWQSVWMFPCIFAAAVLVLFVVLFKDDSKQSAPPA